MKQLLLALLILVSTRQLYAQDADGILLMLNSFGSGCSIRGPQSRKLEEATWQASSILRSFQTQEQCKPLVSAAGQVQGSLDRLTLLDPEYSHDDRYLARLNSRKAAIVSAIEFATAEERSDLILQLRDLEVEIAEASTNNSLIARNEKNQRLYEAANSFRQSSDALLRLLVENQQCMLRNPGTAEALSNIGMALAQSSTLAVETNGISILAGAGLYTAARVSQYVKEKKNSDALKSISIGTLPTAISCALESMNSIYCDSDKIEKIGRFVLSASSEAVDNGRRLASFKGLEILYRYLPVLDSSLLLIKIGNDPSSIDEATIRQQIRIWLEQLQGSKILLSGYFANYKRSVMAISPALTPSERRSQILRIQKEFINDFLTLASVPDHLEPSLPGTGLSAIYKEQKARYYLLGFDPVKVNSSSTDHLRFADLQLPEDYQGFPSDQDPWQKYLKSKDETVFIEDAHLFERAVTTRFLAWFQTAWNDLNSKTNVVFKTDRKEIIASFDRPLTTDYRQTSITAIQKISQFLSESTNQKYLSTKDLRIANEVVSTIENGFIANLQQIDFDLPETDFQKLAVQKFSDILSATKYDEDSRYLYNRVSVLINRVIVEASIELYKQGSPEMIYALASSDVAKELQSYAGKEKSTADLVYDAIKTKGQTIPLIAGFASAFSDPLGKSLKELSKKENLLPRAVERGHLCLQLLGLDVTGHRSLSQDIFKLCQGATLPQLPGAPAAPVFTAELWATPVQERICAHQNWRRKLHLWEMKIKK